MSIPFTSLLDKEIEDYLEQQVGLFHICRVTPALW